MSFPPIHSFVLAAFSDAAGAAAIFREIVELNHFDLACLFPQLHSRTSFLLLEYLSSHCYLINKPDTGSGQSFFHTGKDSS